MPTSLPSRPRTLSWPETLTLCVLLARVHMLHRRMKRIDRRRRGDELSDRAGRRLLRTAREWLSLNERVAAMLGTPETRQMRQLRAIFADPASRPAPIDALVTVHDRPRKRIT